MIHQFADGPFLRGCEVVPGLIIILVVEHDQLVQSLVEETLIDGGFEPDIITSGEETVALLKGHKDKYRALVTDINLRGKMGGWEVVQHARESDPEFPVVHMSGAAAGDWASKGVPNSIMLSKPFAPAQLLTAVSNLLNSGTPTSRRYSILHACRRRYSVC
jgi:DNA-binding response OmpR family regulator